MIVEQSPSLLDRRFARGPDRSKNSPFNESWRKILPKNSSRTKINYKMKKGPGGKVLTTGLFDFNLVEEGDDGEYFAYFKKRPLTGCIKTCSKIMRIIDPDGLKRTHLAELRLKLEDLVNNNQNDQNKYLINNIIKELRSTTIRPILYEVRHFKFRVLKSEYEKSRNRFLTILEKI